MCRAYKETLLRGRRRGASAPAVLGRENTPDAPKYFVVIIRDSSSTNAAGLKLSDQARAFSLSLSLFLGRRDASGRLRK